MDGSPSPRASTPAEFPQVPPQTKPPRALLPLLLLRAARAVRDRRWMASDAILRRLTVAAEQQPLLSATRALPAGVCEQVCEACLRRCGRARAWGPQVGVRAHMVAEQLRSQPQAGHRAVKCNTSGRFRPLAVLESMSG